MTLYRYFLKIIFERVNRIYLYVSVCIFAVDFFNAEYEAILKIMRNY